MNPDWLLLLSTTRCPTQIPQGVHCVSLVNLYHNTFLTTAKRGLRRLIFSFQQKKVTDVTAQINQNLFPIVSHSNIFTLEIVLLTPNAFFQLNSTVSLLLSTAAAALIASLLKIDTRGHPLLQAPCLPESSLVPTYSDSTNWGQEKDRHLIQASLCSKLHFLDALIL